MSDVSLSKIENMIYVIRGQRVMLDSDLAELYEVETRQLNRQVKRNILRFPEDFMFQLTSDEFRDIQKIQDKTVQYGGQRKNPHAFTENGVAMLSSVLNSDNAILVNIAIIRIFTKLRSFLLLEKGLNERMSRLESGTNKIFKVVFERLDAIEHVIDTKLPSTKKKIGLKNE
ncbi:ORF6N domain-containing protein [Peredibacter sp. HCB2-198]|uniref:ORF6N domain-containing protein n=1 Tax=Peredibacter sp. HCB2-198 TaxID=3383025 RepID=UPI0038B679C1